MKGKHLRDNFECFKCPECGVVVAKEEYSEVFATCLPCVKEINEDL